MDWAGASRDRKPAGQLLRLLLNIHFLMAGGLVVCVCVCVLNYKSHLIIKFTLLKYTIRWVLVCLQGCATITMIYMYHPERIFISPKRNPVLTSSHFLFACPLPTTDLLSVSMHLPALDGS